jgi:tRNA dimethylallyltransferase
VIAGPTSSGKTDLALAWAQKHQAEIVCVDSMTLYRGLDIGTAKPDRATRDLVPHHLLDLLDPTQEANAGWWLDLAGKTIVEILGRGKRVILVGGTALYFQLLFHGMAEAPPRDDLLRARLELELSRTGPGILHARLAGVDPLSASRIHPNDGRRLIRALEVAELTGKSLSSFQSQWTDIKPSGPVGPEKWMWLSWPRETLRERIRLRTLQMIRDGWLEEVRGLDRVYPTWAKGPSQAVGYARLREVCQGMISLEEASRKITEGTCQVAKRQETWFRAMKWLEPVKCPDGMVAGSVPLLGDFPGGK